MQLAIEGDINILTIFRSLLTLSQIADSDASAKVCYDMAQEFFPHVNKYGQSDSRLNPAAWNELKSWQGSGELQFDVIEERIQKLLGVAAYAEHVTWWRKMIHSIANHPETDLDTLMDELRVDIVSKQDFL